MSKGCADPHVMNFSFQSCENTG